MRTRLGSAAIALLLVAAPPAVSAQQVEFGGQVRPRFELRSADWFGTAEDESTAATSMRTRVWLRAALPEDITAFVQLQDVRLWGEESSTVDGSADALDLHQGWVELGNPATGPFALRAGRQELAYGEQRLIGAVDWAQQARAFDGVRARGRRGDLVVDGFAMRLREDEAFGTDASFLGAYATTPAPIGLADGYVLYNTFADVTDQWTLGGRWSVEGEPVSWRVEAAYQTGTRADQDASAYLLALRAGMPIGAARAELWYDRLSGDDDPLDGEIKVFDTLFATNHKFYGLMDLFTDIPAHTGGRGLQDLALKTTFPVRADVAIDADLHAFFFSASDGLESGHIGEELDVVGRWAYTPAVGISGGVAVFWPGDGFGLDTVPTWLYLMLDVVF